MQNCYFWIRQLFWFTTLSCVGVPQKLFDFFEVSDQCKNSVEPTELLIPNPTTVQVDQTIIIICWCAPKIVWFFRGLGSVQNQCRIHRIPIFESDNCPGSPHHHLLVCLENCLTFLRAWFSTKTPQNPHNSHFGIWQLSWFTTSWWFPTVRSCDHHLVVCPENCVTFSRARFSTKNLWNAQNPHFRIRQLSWLTTFLTFWRA